MCSPRSMEKLSRSEVEGALGPQLDSLYEQIYELKRKKLEYQSPIDQRAREAPVWPRESASVASSRSMPVNRERMRRSLEVSRLSVRIGDCADANNAKERRHDQHDEDHR